jgi:hypothetical protein
MTWPGIAASPQSWALRGQLAATDFIPQTVSYIPQKTLADFTTSSAKISAPRQGVRLSCRRVLLPG